MLAEIKSYIEENYKEKLRFTDIRIEENGVSVGIEDPNYFARVFKRVEGVSPKQYRESWLLTS